MRSDTQLDGREEWPRFVLTYTTGPASGVTDAAIGEEYIVVFDPRHKGRTHWIAADARSCVPLEDVR